MHKVKRRRYVKEGINNHVQIDLPEYYLINDLGT